MNIESPYSKDFNHYLIKRDNIFFTFQRAIINIPDKSPLAMVSISLNYKNKEKIIGELSTKNTCCFLE